MTTWILSDNITTEFLEIHIGYKKICLYMYVPNVGYCDINELLLCSTLYSTPKFYTQ